MSIHRRCSHRLEYRNYRIWSDRPIDPAITHVLDDATRRLRTSHLYDPQAPSWLFFCNEPWRMRLYTGPVGGVADTLLTQNIYLCEADIGANRIVPPRGTLADADQRSLSYFVAHEATHIVQSRALGRLLKWHPEWLVEGYADYVAKAGDFDFEENRSLLKQDDACLDYARSGLYRRYHLMVAWLLDEQGQEIVEIFAVPPTQDTVLDDLLGNERR